jgi:hypothetical protein
MATSPTLPVISTPPVAGETINCLRCRHCKMLPHSDFQYESVPIHCRKLGRNLPMRLQPCLAGDPRRYIVAKFRKRNPATHGDFVRDMSGPERLFLRHHYPSSPMEFIEAATGRKASTLRAICTRAGIYRAAKAIKRGREWPAEQRIYIESCINSSFWTKRGFGSKTQRADDIRQEIVRRVAELGPERTWLQIRRYAKSLTPAYAARKPRKTARHVELQATRRQERIAAMSEERRADHYRRSESFRLGRARRKGV